MLARHSEHVLDTDALDTPARNRCRRTAHTRRRRREAHAAGDEPLWSESWYFDFADAQQGIGGWVRLGLMPNENTTWVNALLCGPDMPTIALVDFDGHRCDRTDPRRHRTVADLRGGGAGDRSGVRRSGCAAARTTGQAGRGDDGPDVDDGRCPVPVPDHTALRDPVHGVGHRHRRRPRVHGERRARVSATTHGACATGGRWTGCGARCISTTAPTSTGSTCGYPARRRSASATCNGRASRWSNCKRGRSRNLRRQRFTGLDHAHLQPGRPHRDHRRPWPCAGAADVARRPDQPLPARMGSGHHRRRPHRRRLAGMEPQPARSP